ncbi:flagellar protein FlaG [Alicyclobacillus macrosporangiidus]|uniref:flagellar protein FlaG n=1 Tax=Alicyclobacillus macrosporangiidus TaxID=392015 RepID=UPI0026F2820B|nr:flagellar protein FlaG [Alicyclobacillus macrosporangiidus]
MEVGIFPPKTRLGLPADESSQGGQKEPDFLQVSAEAGQTARLRDASHDLKGIERLASQHDVEVHFHYEPKVHRVWLDVVDKTSGKVVEEIPPEAIRHLIESLGSTTGLLVDKRS